jgi:hypothetical protein
MAPPSVNRSSTAAPVFATGPPPAVLTPPLASVVNESPTMPFR